MTARRRRGREVRAQEANLASGGGSAGVPSATSLFALILASCALVLGAGVTWWHSTPLHSTPKGLKPVVCKPEDDAHNYEQLLNWLQGSQALLQNVELDNFNGVRGLKARQHIPAGHPVLSIPYHRTLSIATSSESLTAARVTQGWHEVEDGDVQLDTLALLYEAYVRGSAAPGWLRAYMCMLPQTYDLPVWWKDAWSGEVVAAMPEMARLVAKRKAQVQQFEEMARKAIASMPGGRERFKRDATAWDQNGFTRVFSWAYATAKTRTVTLDLTQKLGKEVRVPPRLSWLKEMGVLVPVLDLANHAPAATSTAYFAVDMTKGSITKGQAPVFSLVASRDIQQGEQITFSYLPEDDDSPRCNERWLIEYGFIVADGRPERDCFTFNLTLSDVASVMIGASDLAAKTHHHPLPQTQAQWQEAMRQRVEQLGYPSELRVQLGVGIAPDTLIDDLTQLAAWAGAAAGLKKVEMSLACRALAAQRVRLQAQLHISQAMAGGHGGPGPTYQQQALLQVVEGAVRAVQRASAVVACTV